MAYSKTTWVKGDEITSQKMNKIEDGIANAENRLAKVIIDFREGGIHGTVACYVGYARHITTPSENFSIESILQEYMSGNYRGRLYIPILLPNQDDDFKAYIFFPNFIDNIALYQITGNISTTKIEGHVREDASIWNSQPWYGFEVQGDGTIVVSYDD